MTLFGDGSPELVDTWVELYDITHPIVLDNGWNVTVRYTGSQIGLPSMMLIKPGLELVSVNGWVTEADIERILPLPAAE